MHPMLNIAIRAIRKGGNIIIQNYDNQNFRKEHKKNNKNCIKNIIYKTYRVIHDIINKSYPNHIILNQKTNLVLFNKKNIYWIINELDGKTNFSKHLPHFCISISVIIKCITTISVIYDPVRNDLFTAVKGQGSQLNGYRIRCNNLNTLDSAIITINLPNKINDILPFYFKIYKQLVLSGISFRCTGSTVLDLAYIASGKIDCLFDFNLNPISFIAGKLQARESGCLISNFIGGHEHSEYHSANLTSSPKIVRLITEKIRRCYLI